MATLNSKVSIQDPQGRNQILSVGQVLKEASRNLTEGNHRNALLMLEQAVRQAPSIAALRYNLGVAQDLSGHSQEAIQSLRKAVETDPANPHFHLGLAQLLRNVNRVEAIPHFQAAIELGVKQPHAFWMLAGIYLEQKRLDDALKISLLGLNVCPDNFELLGVHVIACQFLGLYQEAFASCVKQRKIRPNDVQVLTHLGMALRALGRLRESEDVLRRACSLDKTNAAAHFQLALTLLLAGNYREGFHEYAWRWKLDGVKDSQRVFSQPLWDGSELKGKRIVLWAEQGAGDFIQFSRYLPLVEKKGGHVILEAPRNMLKLARCFPGNFEITASSSNEVFDVHCGLMSLPQKCGEDLNSITLPMKWSVPEDLKKEWEARLGPKQHKRVALIWAGNPDHTEDRHRSIKLEQFKPLFAVPNVEFFSLQVGAASEQIQQVDFGEKLRNIAPLCNDYLDTAAALTQMDLVISVDTSVAHLAGSLGLPTWTLVQFAPDWRWLLGREDTVWYPTMRLFRQPQPCDWESAINSAANGLNDFTSN